MPRVVILVEDGIFRGAWSDVPELHVVAIDKDENSADKPVIINSPGDADPLDRRWLAAQAPELLALLDAYAVVEEAGNDELICDYSGKVISAPETEEAEA